MGTTNKNKTGPKPLEPVTEGGRLYLPQAMIEKKYYISDGELRNCRKRGLPSLKIGRNVYFNEDDFHRYFSGLIGIEDNRKFNGRKIKR